MYAWMDEIIMIKNKKGWNYTGAGKTAWKGRNEKNSDLRGKVK